ncbi:MAG: pyridoxamine 5'-phosphate oxidase [Bacteroidota bacterium]|jgi:pyridoxamine 5'-phosphate oxidase
MRGIIAFILRLLRPAIYPMERHLIRLDEESVDPDPIKQFQRLFHEAVRAKFYLAESTALATASHNGTPSARMVLLKQFDSQGFVFYTNYNSLKAKQLAENPRATLLFHWPEMHCQIRVDGTVEKISSEESDKYFHSRLRDSQIGAVASPQSDVISRDELDRRFEELKRSYEGKEIPRPAHWGGYRLKPACIEFWQGRAARLHDRIVYELQSDGNWSIKRLAP